MNINALLNSNEMKRRMFVHGHSIPDRVPPTQSCFYMPLITIVYLLVKCQRQRLKMTLISNEIIGSLSIFFSLFRNRQIDDVYVLLCHVIETMFKYVNEHYSDIEKGYRMDGGLPINKVSHIRDKMQEDILSHSCVSGEVFTEFVSIVSKIYSTDMCESVHNILESDIQKNVKLMMDMMIQIYYSNNEKK